MKYVFSKSQNKFETSQFIVVTDRHKQIALNNGYVEVSDEDYEKLIKHELCWQGGVLVPYTKTADEIAQEQKQAKIAEIHKRITKLKANLQAWDYKTSKHLDGDYTDEEWAEIVVQRREWRGEINRLEDELNELRGAL